MPIRLNRAITMAVAISLSPVSVSNLMAFGSKEKSPEEQASDSRKHAVVVYNSGVKHMEAARAIGRQTDSLFAYNYRATTDVRAKKEFEKAVSDFKKATALDPDLAEAYNNLGYSYRKLGQLNESLDAYAKAITLNNNFAQAHEYRGETYLAMGDLAKAQEDLSFLNQIKSPYADTLARSIEAFQLQKFVKPEK
ncbi:hypothetical protein C3F09_05645 [candidate division GN15 bacterium]|uniref:Tetratricopeptide repeat protein n=1 Tax=candidate division GN15 bacterium TaxID=2072418 RepID=A0A855X7Y1_9BACT|nr:MAG: hypothetical protein C3F09_05645 [candidate division GN15 bacterium]